MLARVRPTACLRGAAERESRNLQTGYAAELRYSQATRSDVTIGIDSSSTRRQYGSSDKTPFSAGLYVTAQTALCRWVSLQDADKSARFRNAGNPTRKPVSMLPIKADVRQSGYDENGVPAVGLRRTDATLMLHRRRHPQRCLSLRRRRRDRSCWCRPFGHAATGPVRTRRGAVGSGATFFAYFRCDHGRRDSRGSRCHCRPRRRARRRCGERQGSARHELARAGLCCAPSQPGWRE